MKTVLRAIGWMILVPAVAISGFVVGAVAVGTRVIDSGETLAQHWVDSQVGAQLSLVLLANVETANSMEPGTLDWVANTEWMDNTLSIIGLQVDREIQNRQTGSDSQPIILDTHKIAYLAARQAEYRDLIIPERVIVVEKDNQAITTASELLTLRDRMRPWSIASLLVSLLAGMFLLARTTQGQRYWQAWAALWFGLGILASWFAIVSGADLLWKLGGDSFSEGASMVHELGPKTFSEVGQRIVSPLRIWVLIGWGAAAMAIIRGERAHNADKWRQGELEHLEQEDSAQEDAELDDAVQEDVDREDVALEEMGLESNVDEHVDKADVEAGTVTDTENSEQENSTREDVRQEDAELDGAELDDADQGDNSA